ncbi:MAG TPA: hypothetical protein DDX91_03630 [Ruminococcaceae bacterium]|nr:hypothetical protein [Oscillospiraceae bacterium]
MSVSYKCERVYSQSIFTNVKEHMLYSVDRNFGSRTNRRIFEKPLCQKFPPLSPKQTVINIILLIGQYSVF